MSKYITVVFTLEKYAKGAKKRSNRERKLANKSKRDDENISTSKKSPIKPK